MKPLALSLAFLALCGAAHADIAQYRLSDGTNKISDVSPNTPLPATGAGASATTPTYEVTTPSAAAAAANTYSRNTTAASTVTGKATAGNLYSATAEASVAGFLMLFDAASVPADGTVTPVYCIPVAAGGSGSIAVNGSPPIRFATGIQVRYSSTGCFSATSSATALITLVYQ